MQNTEKPDFQEITYKAPKPDLKDSTILLRETGDRNARFLYFSAFIVNLLAFVVGIAFAWTSPVIPRLNGSVDSLNNPLGRSITPSEESWIASLLCLGGACGPLLAGKGADQIGRKKTLIFLSLPLIISFVITSFANTVTLLYCARFLMGVGVGGTFTALSMYLGEIAEDRNRGALGCLLSVFLTSGCLFAYIVGPTLTVKEFSLVCLAPFTVYLPIFAILIPDSPLYLASTQKQRELEESLMQLRNRTLKELEKELLEIKNQAQESKQSSGGLCVLFKTRNLRNGLIVIITLIILQQFSGINAVISYMQSIFDSTGSSLSPETSTIIVGAVQVLTTIITSSLVDKLGRRILLFLSAIGSCFSLTTLGLYFCLKTNGSDVSSLFWLPVLSLLVFIVAFNLGLGPLPWAMLGELFPGNVKSTAAALATSVCLFASFVVTLVFPQMVLVLGMAKSFWLFALVCLGGSVFVFLGVPETKGRTLQEIQEILGKK